MRIITGSARGRRLETLSGEETRPTSEKVKEALFSAIQFDIEGRRVLDLFAGSGQLGIEALSRGASGCVFVDRNPAAVEVIRRNLKAAGLSEASQAVAQDVASFLVRPGDSFDVAFLDPPYGANLLRDTLERVTPHMNRGGLIVCESDAGQEMPERVGDFALARTYRYGRVHIWRYRWETVEPEDD